MLTIDTLIHKLEAIKAANHNDGSLPVEVTVAEHYVGDVYPAENLQVVPTEHGPTVVFE